MTGPTTGRWAAKRRDQDGYVLLIVLVACGIFGLIVMSLLAMVGTDARASSAYVNSDSAKRAIDGALQLGIGQVKAVNSGSLAITASPCAGFTSSQLEIEGRTLDIACTDATDLTVPAPRALPAAESTDASSVLTLRDGWDSSAIVTDAYSQSWEQVFSFGPLCQNLRIGPLVTCINEKAGLTVESLTKILNDCRTGTILDQAVCPIKVVWRVLSGGSGLMHVGDEPLQVYGNVDVARWGLASAFSPSSSAGLNVTNGVYRQGVAAEGSCSPTVLAELGNLVPSRTGAVSASSSCGAVTAPAMPTPPTPTTQDGQVPAATDCVSGGIVPIEPGAFNVAKVRDLNALFKSAACNNVTFWFKTGAYYFDGASLYDNAALNFDNATSNFVFGEPRGWAPTSRAPYSVFPEACNRNAAGVSIVLGPTTSIVHNAGAVAICGNISQTVGPAVLAPVTLTATPDVSPAFTTTCNNGWHVCTATWPLGPLSSPDPSLGDRPITSAKMQIKAKIDNAQPQNVVWWTGYGDSKTTVRFSRGSKSCAVPVDNHSYASWPVNNLTTPFVVDLIAEGSPCKNVITTQADIEEGTFSVDFDLNRAGCSQQWYGWSCAVINYTLDTASVVTTTTEMARRTPMPMTVQVDPAAHRTFNVFGSVVLPYTQIDVKWWQTPATAATTYTLPVFVGSVDARALFSHPGNDQVPAHIGTLASRTLQPLERRVRITASTGPPGNQRILGSTLVSIVDEKPVAPATSVTGAVGTFSPGEGLVTSDWNYCNVPLTPTATC